jgi:hypothetical protein
MRLLREEGTRDFEEEYEEQRREEVHDIGWLRQQR